MPQQAGQLTDRFASARRILIDQSLHRIKRVEKEMWIELRAKSHPLRLAGVGFGSQSVLMLCLHLLVDANAEIASGPAEKNSGTGHCAAKKRERAAYGQAAGRCADQIGHVSIRYAHQAGDWS